MSKIITKCYLAIALLVTMIALVMSIDSTQAGAQVDPMPTMLSTSWVATPTMIPTMPTPEGLYHFTVYLPLIGGE
jgi:hypothetical protein